MVVRQNRIESVRDQHASQQSIISIQDMSPCLQQSHTYQVLGNLGMVGMVGMDDERSYLNLPLPEKYVGGGIGDPGTSGL